MKWEYLVDLEFDKVLESISELCFTEEGRNRVLSIRPLTFGRKYSEAVQMISYKHSLISRGIEICDRISIPSIDYDLINVWKKSSKEGGILLPKTIYGIYEFLKSVKNLLIFIDNLDEDFRILKDLIKVDVSYFLDLFDVIENLVRKSIDRDGGIIRTATHQLDRIISEKEKIELTVMKILNNYINDPENEEFLQEKFVTIRNNRFVIPVKMEYINAVDGFVQDISSTGHTAFVEPRFIQSYTIRYLELIDEEKKEIDKILREITGELSKIVSLVDPIVDTIGTFDELQAISRYAKLTNSSRPKLVLKPVIKLIQARHPFLKNPVPIDVELGDGDESFGGLIISGPNTSGKTVSIKTLGLLTAMALSGLFIPASSESVVGYFDKILADIGDPQSIERDLSTFSAHIMKINEIIKIADYNTLIILDELGTGTDPREGEALAVAILKFLSKRKSKIAVATHYTLVKKLPLSSEYFKNAYMEFDEQTLKPMYKLVFGMPGSSNAILIASKLGLSEEITQEALKIMLEGIDVYEKFVIEIQKEKREVQRLKDEIIEKMEEVERLKKEYKLKLSEIETRLEKIRKKEYDSLMSDIYEAKLLVSRIREKLLSEKLTQKDLEEINKEISNIASSVSIDDNVRDLIRVKSPKVGDKVFSNKFKQEGVITRIFGDNRVEILSGKLKFITSIEDLFEV